MRWVRRWTATFRWERGRDGLRSKTVDTPAELRALLDWARAEPGVWKWYVEPGRHLVGDEPTECRNGHSYAGGSATAARRDFTPCTGCDGHLIYLCHCGDRRHEPELAYDCQPAR